MKLTSIQVKRHEYNITTADRFLDNGVCVQLLTQAKQWGEWHKVTPVLSKRAIKEIGRFKRIQHPHNYGSGVEVFSLQN